MFASAHAVKVRAGIHKASQFVDEGFSVLQVCLMLELLIE